MLLLGASCDSSTDYAGLPPEEAAEQLSAIVCDALFECGALWVSCDGAPSASYVPADELWTDEAECLDFSRESYGELFTGCARLGLSAEQRATVNRCYNRERHCLSADELEDVAVVACNGGEAFEACAGVADIVTDCLTCYDTPHDPICDGA